MAVITELIRSEANGAVSFGDYTQTEKKKLENFAHGQDSLKVKTFNEITRLEKNGLFVYESVPGTAVNSFEEKAEGISFTVEGPQDAQITVGLAEDTEYTVIVAGESIGKMKTNLGGKLSFNVNLEGCGEVPVVINK